MFSQKPLVLYVSFKVQGNKKYLHDAGHMNKFAVMRIYSKNPLSQRTYFHKTEYIASWTPVFRSLFKL